jgi:CheY-like chemotaxis protein
LAASAIPQASETILVVDDDQDMCWVLEVALAGLGYVVKTVGTAQSAIASVADHAFPSLLSMRGYRIWMVFGSSRNCAACGRQCG